MASLKALKMRIASVKSTQKITKAMKMVAAAKLRKAQMAAEAGRPFAEEMTSVVEALAAKVAGSDTAPPLLAGSGSDQRHMLVVMTSERGLAGAFNANIVRAARRKADALCDQGKDVHFYIAGKKGRGPLKRFHADRIAHDYELGHIKTPTFADAQGLADDLVRRFEAGEFDVAHIFYARFQSALVQEPVARQVIPMPLNSPKQAEGDDADDSLAAMEYEPDEEAILADLLPRNIAVQIFRGMLENGASEQGSRMTAMDNATRNAGDMINRLTIEYNRSRQAAITKELIEIISGAEAL